MRRSIVLACLIGATCAATVFAHGGAHAATAAAAWSNNGATACTKYLTPAVTGAFLRSPAGAAMQADAHSCNAYPLYLSLGVMNGGAAAFRAQMPRIAGAHPIAGIGDAAYWNDAGALASVKGDRKCEISILLPNLAKLSGAALAQKFGAVCNRLFALP